jgi:hypothetical protein
MCTMVRWASYNCISISMLPKSVRRISFIIVLCSLKVGTENSNVVRDTNKSREYFIAYPDINHDYRIGGNEYSESALIQHLASTSTSLLSSLVHSLSHRERHDINDKTN